MSGDSLTALGGAFLAAGLLGRLGRRAGLPTIPLFMAAGILFGPHTPGTILVHDPAELELVAALGLILLLFHLGLEFSLRDLVAGGSRLLGVGLVALLLNVGAGLVFGFTLRWGTAEALVLAGAVGISSSAIVTKLLVELRRLANPETPLILGIVVVEDIFLALYLAALQPVLGGGHDVTAAVWEFGRAFAVLVTLATVARFGPRLVGRLIDTPDDELLTVCFIGLAVLVAGAAEELGVSDAIAAFMVGLILAETAPAERIERLVLPLRDAFGALFFFAFGLTIDPAATGPVLIPVGIAVAVTILANLTVGVVAARLHRFDSRAAAKIGLTLVGRGEFSLILATLAAAAGLDARIGPFVALYVLILAVAGPLLTSYPAFVARWLPSPAVSDRTPRS